MITNRQGLPAPLVNAIRNDPYSRGDSDISVTQLIQPPQLRRLLKGRQVEEDAADCVWRLLGQAMHTILERDPGTAMVEKRLFTRVRGWKVSGQFDVYDEGVLTDYKITSVYAREGKIEWTNQLNLLAALCRRNNMPVQRVQIVAIFRDWRPKEALSEDYPQAQVAVIPAPVWTSGEAEEYLEQRVALHQMEVPPLCTDEERWLQPSKWALMKKGQKRAIKLFDSENALLKYAEKNGIYELVADGSYYEPEGSFAWKLVDGHYVAHRPGSYRRCESYCNAAPFCPQWQAERTKREVSDLSA